MYLSSTDKIEVVLAGVITTNQLQCVASYQLITSAGVTLPESSTQQNTNSTTPIDLVTGAASTNTDVVEMTIFNADTVSATVTVTKDVSGSNFILVRALLQVGDTLMYGRNGQWSILSQSSQESVLLTAFTSSGTWTKPAGLKRVLVTCGGAGGGSGSGRQGAAGENRFGGAGGAGGAVVWRQIAASDLTSTVAVTIGAGGTAGAAPAGINTNGNAGGAGGDTSFGGLVIAKGGLGGNAGTTASGAAVTGGQSSACTPAYMPYSISGSSSGSGQTTTNSAGGIGFNGVIGCPGGGGGAGINNLNVSGTGANTGGGLWVNGIFTVGPVSGASPNGVDNVNRFLFFSNTISAPVGIGTAGAGGTPAFPQGGTGGKCAGAGGSAGTLNGAALTPGATGGGGFCGVVEFY
jgi:hypothetical protein